MVGPLRQDPVPKQKKPRDLPPILSSPEADAPTTPKKPNRPASVSGFVENALDDAWDLAKGLYEILPASYKSYKENVPYILKNLDSVTPGLVAGAAKDTAKDIGKAMIEPYVKHGASVVYHRPVTVLSDFVTVLTLGGSSIKNAGKLAKASGGGARAERLIQAGKWLEELPRKVGRGVVDSTVKTATGGKLDLAKRREFLALKGEEQGRRILKVEQDVTNVVNKIDALNPAEKELFHKARVMGDVPGYGIADDALPPNVKAALDSFSDLVNKADPNLNDHGITEFYKSRGLLSAEAAENSIAKKFALEAFDDVSAASVAKAKDLIATAKRKPVYGQNVFPDKGPSFSADTVLDDMVTGGKHMRVGKVDPLEALKGAKGYTRDPSIYVREMIKNFRNTEAKMRLSERLLEEKSLIKGSAGSLDPSKDIPEGVHRKYYEDRVRAEALKSITDPTLKRLLKWEYVKNNSSLIRIYDRMQGLFARSATKWNPKWVTGNVIGDAVLGLLAGSDWVQGARYLRKGAMPAQIAARNVTLNTRDILEQPGRLSRAVGYLPEKASDLSGYIDQATRAGIISRDVGRRLKETAIGFEGSAETLENVLRSTDRFSDVQVGMRLLAERVERGSAEVVRRTKLISRLEAQEQGLRKKLLDMELKKKAGIDQKADSALSKAFGKDKELRDIAPSSTAKMGGWEAAQKARAKADQLRRGGVLGKVGEPSFERGLEKLDDLRQKIVNLTAENRAVIRDITDDLAKRGDLEKLVPGLREQVALVRPAVERANAFVGDYLALDGFEQGVLRRAIPFYPWAKAMSMLAFRLPFLSPVKTFAWNRFSDALMTLTDDPDLPEDFKGRIPVGVTSDGKTVWAKADAYSPFGSLRTSSVAEIPVPGMLNLAERNPFIGLAFEFFGGKTIWDAGTLPYGEQMVSIGDGAVLRIKPNGKIERDIPQAPLVSSVMHMFPTTQLVQQVLTPYWTNKYNWAGMPEPILNADGTYKYPKELWDRLGAAVGLNLQTRSRDEIIRSRRGKAAKNVNELRKQYRRTNDPDEREMILNAIRDYVSQEIEGRRP